MTDYLQSETETELCDQGRGKAVPALCRSKHVSSKLRKESREKWEREWEQTTKGINTRQYFPNVSQRLAIKLPISPNFTAMLTGHGKLKTYYHQFKITEDAVCICNEGDQTIDHLIWDCQLLKKERNTLRKRIITK